MIYYVEKFYVETGVSMEKLKDFSEKERARYKSIFEELKDHIDEKTKRLLAAAMVKSLGFGGQKVIYELTGVSPDTLKLGVSELNGEVPLDDNRIRRTGGGRKPITEIYPGIEEELLKLVAESSQGDPESPLLWTTKSTAHLAQTLTDKGMPVSDRTVSQLLSKNNYSMQANAKRFEAGSASPAERDQQFQHISAMTRAFQEKGNPVISVDTKKKELLGHYKNGGREYREKGKPLEVNAHDFPDKAKGKAIPYGVYDIHRNEGWVHVGNDHDTAQFAVESIRQWWLRMGLATYPNATELLINADGGGSNGSRNKLWKVELQKLSHEIGFPITVAHFPPGTSKWNKIEHQMFSHISMNWRARPLTSLEVVVNLIASTTTKTGLKIQSAEDRNKYETGIKVSDEEISKLHIEYDDKQNKQWNYRILPVVKS